LGQERLKNSIQGGGEGILNRKRKSAAVAFAESRANALNSIDPALDLGNGLTLADYKAKTAALKEKKINITAICPTWTRRSTTFKKTRGRSTISRRGCLPVSVPNMEKTATSMRRLVGRERANPNRRFEKRSRPRPEVRPGRPACRDGSPPAAH
jgi:hypothetical protein